MYGKRWCSGAFQYTPFSDESLTILKTDDSAVHATKDTYAELQRAYDFFNERLFDGELPGALITLQRSGKSLGHYSSVRYVNRRGAKADEINLNPAFFATRPVEDTLSTLAHEMAHQWRERNGEPPRRCYHDRAWGTKMLGIGLQPSSTGRPGGKEVGEKMSHYVLPDGDFIRVCKELLATSFGILWFDRFSIQCGKDYDYAPDAKVTLAANVIKAAQASSRATMAANPVGTGSTGQDEGSEADVATLVDGLDADQDADVPLFSPTPAEAGLDIVSIEPSSRRGADGADGAQKKVDNSNRVKFTCGKCGLNAWAKPGANLVCGDCRVGLVGRG